MGRRSDHSREELRELIISTGHALMAEAGLARFSAREVAKRIGYSIGTIYNVFGSHDALIAAINSRSFDLWTGWVSDALGRTSGDRIATLVRRYFSFARAHPHLWHAIFDHHLSSDAALSPEDQERRGKLTSLIVREVADALGRPAQDVGTLARSLIAIVHGHCVFALSGAWTLMGEEDPEASALARVRETMAAARS